MRLTLCMFMEYTSVFVVVMKLRRGDSVSCLSVYTPPVIPDGNMLDSRPARAARRVKLGYSRSRLHLQSRWVMTS